MRQIGSTQTGRVETRTGGEKVDWKHTAKWMERLIQAGTDLGDWREER